MNKNIRLADLARASKFMIGPFRSCIIMASFKVTISTKLDLVVDLLRFHQLGNVVYAQAMESVFYEGS